MANKEIIKPNISKNGEVKAIFTLFEEIRSTDISDGQKTHIRELKKRGEEVQAFEYRKGALREKKETQLREGLKGLEKTLKEEGIPDLCVKTAVEVVETWSKNKLLGEITDEERKKELEKTIKKYGPQAFEWLIREKTGSGKTRIREIIDMMLPSADEKEKEFTELEIKLIGKEWLSPQEAIKKEYTFIWLGNIMGFYSDVKRKKEIERIFHQYGSDVFDWFAKEKTNGRKTRAREVIDRMLSPEEEALREFAELETKLLVREWLSFEEAIEAEYTIVLLGEKLEHFYFSPEEREEKLTSIYDQYPSEITEKFVREKARNIMNRIMPSTRKR